MAIFRTQIQQKTSTGMNTIHPETEAGVTLYNDSTGKWGANVQVVTENIIIELGDVLAHLLDENGYYYIVSGIKGTAETGGFRSGEVVLTPADLGTYTKEEIEALVQGRSRGLVLETESQLATALSNSKYVGVLEIADNILIEEVDVPDYWITETSTTLRGTNGTNIIDQTDYDNGWRGYFRVSPLETQKVVLTEYQLKEDGNLKTNAKNIVDAINEVRQQALDAEADASTVNDAVEQILDGILTVKKAEQATNANTAMYAIKADYAVELETPREITLNGDVSGSGYFDGASNTNIDAVLSNTGVSAGTYSSVTVDQKGRVTKGQQVVEVGSTVGAEPSADLAVNGIFFERIS